MNAGLNFPLIIVTPNESMPFSAYYSSSRRSGRSHRFRVTPESGERNLSLEERESDLGGWLAGPEEAPPVSVAKRGISGVLFAFS